MNYDEIVTLIGSVGFPIIACFALYQYMRIQSETHKEETRGYMESINALTNKIDILIAKIDHLIIKGDKTE